MKENIITFGEIMLRLTPPEYNTIAQTQSFIANYGGGEANVAVSLSCFGHNCYFISKLPPNQLGTSCLQSLKAYGVDTSYVVRGSDLMGIYFLETGFGGRPSKVVYNRKHSAINTIKLSELNLDEIFKDATWFHVSGISLALSENVRNALFACLEACKKYNVTVSFDFNFRSKLWTIEEAIPQYKKVIPYVDVLFASYFDATKILGYEPLNNNIDPRIDVFNQLINNTHIKYIFGTDRTVYSATENALSAFYIAKDISLNADNIKFNIYDRIGGGDAFASGVIHGLINDFNNPEYALNFGLATSVLKHTLYGDVCTLNTSDIESFMLTQGKGRVQR